MAAEQVDALVIFGATGDLAKLETFPALVGLVERGVLNVPVIGVAKNGWGLDQFRDYAVASLKLNNIDPGRPGREEDARAAEVCGRRPRRRRHLPRHVGRGRRRPADPVLPRGTAAAVRPDRAGHRDRGPGQGQPDHGGEAVRHRPGQRDKAGRAHAPVLPGGRHLPGGPLARPGPGGEPAVRPVRQLGHRAAAQPGPRGEHPDHHGRGVRRLGPGPVLRPDRRDPGCAAEPHAPGDGQRDGRPAGRQRAALLAGHQVPADLVA